MTTEQTTAAPLSAEQLDKQRALFEAAEMARGSDLSKAWAFGATDEYANPAVENRWQGWKESLIAQARAAEPAPEDMLVALRNAERLLRAAGFAMNGTASSKIVEAIATHSQATAPQPVGEQDERALFMHAIDSTYPIPNNPHQSVVERAMSNREAFSKGWEQARAALDMCASSAPAENLRNDLMAVDSKLVAIINAADGAVYNKLKDVRNDLVRIWLPLSKAPAASPTATPSSAAPEAQAGEAVAWLITTKEPKAGYPLATCNADVVRSTTPGIHIVTPLAPAASVAPAELTASQIAAGAAVLDDDGKPVGRNVAIMVADAMQVAQAEDAKDAAPGHREDYYLMANARRVAEKPIYAIRSMPNWVFASELFATGSTAAYQICRDAGIDPDGYKIDRATLASTQHSAKAGDTK